MAVLSIGQAIAVHAESSGDWPTYGHDPGGARFSPLKQIDTGNVASLVPAWTYHMKPATPVAGPDAATSTAEQAQRLAEGVSARRRAARFSASQTTPLVVDGMMYISTPYRRVVALDPETGNELWVYEVPGPGQPSQRGVEYWPGDKQHAPRILFGTRDGRLIALDARSGKPAADFGVDGSVDLKTADVVPTVSTSPFAQYGMTSPPIVYRNLVITGAAVQESPSLGASGDVRAWDVVTGQMRWIFHTVPRPGEFGNDTWQGDSWKSRSGVNAWGFITVDTKRGIAYLPTGAPAWDRYGADRVGNNLFSSSVIALDANTGKRLWHFQLVHHDVWDYDAESPPLLLEVKRGLRSVPAVAIVSKTGYFYLLNRVTGEPLFPVEERPVPASDVPGEQVSATQPIPTVTPSLVRQSFTMDDLVKVTAELESYCRNWIESNQMRMGLPFQPSGFKTPTISFPGRLGGANWGGGSYSPQLGYVFINVSNLGHVEQLSPREDGSITNASPTTGRFSDRDRKLMCQQPPWGTLAAVDVKTGKIAWQSTLGVSDNLPEAVARTGRPNIGGSIATAGGLVFVGATDDARLRAFDARSGQELWAVKLPAAAHATPMTYLGRKGKQYVAITAAGGSFLDSPSDSDELHVFALP
jgi:quinoprotein glucose dehydrogenase